MSGTYRSEDAQYFQLDKTSNKLSLQKQLDREEIDHHQIRIIASNQESLTPGIVIPEKSMLYINITVNDVNDNPPTFVYKRYATGISERDLPDKTLMVLEATDPDLDDKISYFLLQETMTVSSSDLDGVKDTAFRVNYDTGALTLNFQVQSWMSGYFEFTVEARDLVDHTDTATVKIYVVSESNRVSFTFSNTLEQTRNADQQRLAEIFSDSFGAECVIDDILPHQIEGVIQENQTVVRIHCIRDDEAISASEIEM